MKLQTRSFVARKPETIDITAFFKKFCITTRTIEKSLKPQGFTPKGTKSEQWAKADTG